MSPPWMPFWVADYLGDTRRLNAQQHGAYLLLIMEHWVHGSLPDDDEQLARIACVSEREWKAIRPVIRPFFKEGWVHSRVAREIVAAEEKYQRRAEAGRRGGRSSVKAPELPGLADDGSNAQAMLHQPQPQPQTHSDQRSENNPTTASSVTSLAPGGGGVSLEILLREASGLVGAKPSALRKTEVIQALIAEGCSLERTILPALRSVAADKPTKDARSWSYFLDIIRRWSGPVLVASPASQVSVWVARDSRQGLAWDEFEAKRKAAVPWIESGRYSGWGRGLPSLWPPDHPNHTPAREVA